VNRVDAIVNPGIRFVYRRAETMSIIAHSLNHGVEGTDNERLRGGRDPSAVRIVTFSLYPLEYQGSVFQGGHVFPRQVP